MYSRAASREHEVAYSASMARSTPPRAIGSGEGDDVGLQGQLVTPLHGRCGITNLCRDGDLLAEPLVEVQHLPCQQEIGEDIRHAVGQDPVPGWAVGHVEVQVRRTRTAGVAHLAQLLAAVDAIANADLNTAGLQVRVGREPT